MIRKIYFYFFTVGRSREGAWIEMPRAEFNKKGVVVAPVRERGLKCLVNDTLLT